jgi:hypothetical protein
VTVSSGINAVTSSWIGGSSTSPQILFVADGNAFFATCASGCGTTAPTFNVLLLRALASWGALSVDGTGVVRVAIVEGSNPYDLWFASCANGCASLANWSGGVIVTPVDDVEPTLGNTGSVQALGVRVGGSPSYGECAVSNCTNASSWQFFQFPGTSTDAPTATIDANSRRVAIDGAFRLCTSNCTTNTNPGWTAAAAVGSGNLPPLLAVPDPLHLISVDPTAGLNDAFCPSNCTPASAWTTGKYTGPGGAVARGGLAISPAASMTVDVVYTDTTGALQRYETTGASLGKVTAVSACGAPVLGQKAALVLSDNDNASILFYSSSAREVRYTVGGP